jgi:hypothetical protein
VGRARRLLAEAGTIACCLIAACERVRDLGRAAEWCERLKELCQGWSFELMIAVCRTHYGSTLVSRGDPRSAVDTAEVFLRAIPDRESLERAPALEVLVRAGTALGDESAARAALAGLRTLADLVRSPPMLAAALAAQGAVANAFGDLA